MSQPRTRAASLSDLRRMVGTLQEDILQEDILMVTSTSYKTVLVLILSKTRADEAFQEASTSAFARGPASKFIVTRCRWK